MPARRTKRQTQFMLNANPNQPYMRMFPMYTKIRFAPALIAALVAYPIWKK